MIHVSVDGLRSDALATLGAGRLPNIHRLLGEGAWTDAARTDVDYTWTLPNHVSMLTGRPVTAPGGHQWTSNTDPAPGETLHDNPSLPSGVDYIASVFDVAHDNGLRTGLYASKPKLSLIDASYNAANGAADTTGADDGRDKIDVTLITSNMTSMTTGFLTDMAAEPFGYAFVHYLQPDGAGHGNGWDPTPGSAYGNAVEAVDDEIGRILDLVDANPSLGPENTTIILTADHGGGAPTPTSHDDVTEPVNYTVPFVVWGGGAAPGDLYGLNPGTRQHPGTGRPPYAASPPPIRNSDGANLALDLLGLPPVPGSSINAAGDLAVHASSSSGAYRDVVVADGATAYWRLADAGAIAADEVGSLAGSYAGSPSLGAASLVGDTNAAVAFDGSDDAVFIPDSSLVNIGPRDRHTIELWFRADTVTGRQVLYEQGGGLKGAALYLDGASLYYAAWSGSPVWPGGDVYLSTPVSAGRTYHAVLTFDAISGNATAYLDGTVAGSRGGIGTLNSHGSDVGIGAMNDSIRFHDGADTGSGWHFDGVIDEVAVYPAALTAAQVSAHFAAGGSPSAFPAVSITSPSAGAVVSGTTTVAVHATDPQDARASLDVDVSYDGGITWSPAVWDGGAGAHVASWDTTAFPDGPYDIDARVFDGDGNVSLAAPVGVTVANAASSYASVVAADGPTAWWRLGDGAGTTAADAAGSNPGTYVGGPGLGAPGLVGDGDAAVDFDGTDDAVDVPDSGLINLGLVSSRTVEAWFRADTTSKRQVVYEQGGGLRGIALYVDGGRLYAGAWNLADDGSADTPWASGPAFVSAPVTAGAPYHAILTIDRASDRLRLFLNGEAVGEVAGIGYLYPHGSDVGIGAMNDSALFHDGAATGDGFRFDGTIDEVAIYPTALDAAAVAAHHAAGSPAGDSPPTVAVATPANGATVSGSLVVAVVATDAEDAVGALQVDVSTDGGGAFTPATWNPATSRYEHTWDTTAAADGDVTVVARATDSAGNSSTASVAVTVGNAPAPYAGAVAADAPSVWWRLGDGAGSVAGDQVGSLDGTYTGGPALGEPGLVGDADGAVRFDGIDDGIDVPDSGLLNLGTRTAHTVELWFRADTVTSRQVLYEQGGTARGLAIYIDAGRVYVAGWNTPDDSSADTPWASGPVHLSTPVTAGAAHHAVLVYDRSTGRIEGFLDGASFGAASGVGTLHSHGSDIGIGAMNDSLLFHDGGATGDGFRFEGVIDEVAVYPRALAATRVAAHHAAGAPVGDAPPAVAFAAPAAGATVSGTTTVRVDAADAADPPGSLLVEVSTDGGASFAPAAWNAAGAAYERAWDTTTAPDGPATLVARATDSAANVATISIGVTVANAASSYRDTVLADAPSVWWRLDDTAPPVADDAVGVLDATFTGDPVLGTPGLAAGAAVRFDGTGDFVAVPDSGLVNLGRRTRHTIELWFQADSVAPRQVLYEQGGTARGLVIYLDGGRIYAGGWNTVDDSTADTPWAAGPVHLSAPVSAGAPHHVVLVYDQPANRFEAYLDAVSMGAVSGIGTLHSHGSDVGIGAMNDSTKFHDGDATGSGFFFSGVIDEVALYPAALDAAAVAAHHAAGAQSGAAPAPVFRAGGDCDTDGQLTRFEIRNPDVVAHDAVISRSGVDVIGPVTIAPGGIFSTAVAFGGNGDVVEPWVARWADATAPSRTLLFRASLCNSGLPQPARGPSALIGAECSGGVAVVDWWMRNSAADAREMNVTLTDAANENEAHLWPPGGGTVLLAPGETASATSNAPPQYGPGDEVRVRAWWRIGDPSAHNRVGVVLPDCG